MRSCGESFDVAAVDEKFAEREGGAVELAEGHVGADAHRADAGVAQWLFGQAVHLVLGDFFARGVVGFALDADRAAGGAALAGEGLDEFGLAVAGDADDADDFAGVDVEGEIFEGFDAGVIVGAEFVEGKFGRVRMAVGAVGDGRRWSGCRSSFRPFARGCSL